jgi:hypothetical protein
MPTQERLRRHDRPVPTSRRQHPAERGKEGAIGCSKHRPGLLPTKHHQLMAQNEQLDILGELAAAATHERPQHHREPEVRKRKEHPPMLPDRAPGDTENRNLVLEPLMLFPRLHEGAGSPRRKPSGMTERPRRPPQAGPLCTRSARSRAALECLAAWRLRTTQKDGAGLARRRANPGARSQAGRDGPRLRLGWNRSWRCRPRQRKARSARASFGRPSPLEGGSRRGKTATLAGRDPLVEPVPCGPGGDRRIVAVLELLLRVPDGDEAHPLRRDRSGRRRLCERRPSCIERSAR